MILSICIPTYNRLDNLDNCLNSILISSKNVNNFDFEVCVSDNFSDDNPQKIINKYKNNLNIKFNRNNKNQGFALNAIKTVELSSAKYAWLIGNDDLILPNTLCDLKKLFTENNDVDYFFINSFLLDTKYLKKFSHPFHTSNLQEEKMRKLSKVIESKKVNFWEIIDPKVSWEFLIGIFLSVFNRKLWLEGLKCIHRKNIEDTRVWSNFDNTCLNAKIISTMFHDKKSFICAKPLSVNLIGVREWGNLYDFVEIVRIPELIDYYRTQGLGFWKYIYCKNYSLRNFFNFFTKIFLNGKKGGISYINFYNHFFKNLVFPYAWFSIIFFVLRLVKKILRIRENE